MREREKERDTSHSYLQYCRASDADSPLSLAFILLSCRRSILYSEPVSVCVGGGLNQFQIIAPLNNWWPCLGGGEMINDDTMDNMSKTHTETLSPACQHTHTQRYNCVCVSSYGWWLLRGKRHHFSSLCWGEDSSACVTVYVSPSNRKSRWIMMEIIG